MHCFLVSFLNCIQQPSEHKINFCFLQQQLHNEHCTYFSQNSGYIQEKTVIINNKFTTENYQNSGLMT
jgi:hypothetical protein